jgi:hypothetical protein
VSIFIILNPAVQVFSVNPDATPLPDNGQFPLKNQMPYCLFAPSDVLRSLFCCEQSRYQRRRLLARSARVKFSPHLRPDSLNKFGRKVGYPAFNRGFHPIFL